jgi:predicted RNA binding protein YcfA (HicA-like mRNA interferase family)
MNRLPGLTGRELIAALSKAGFQVARTKGSHHLLRHADGRPRFRSMRAKPWVLA